MCRMAELPDRAVIEVSGPEARGFLHGIITNSMEKARDGHAVHAGLLTPQGKLMFDFFIFPVEARAGEEGGGDEEFLFDVPAAVKDELVKRLTFYRLRAKVEIDDVSGQYRVFAAWEGSGVGATDNSFVFADPRLETLGYRILTTDHVLPDCQHSEAEEYHAWRITHGVPEGGRDYAFGEVFPHEADFDQLNGVDFRKGCYVGQEVVSRMQHKTTVRKRIVPVEGEGALPEAGAEIKVDDFPIGAMGSSSGGQGLALIRLDRAEKAIEDGKAITADGVKISLRKPGWATFDVPS